MWTIKASMMLALAAAVVWFFSTLILDALIILPVAVAWLGGILLLGWVIEQVCGWFR